MLRINQLRLPVGHTREELERKVQKLLGISQIDEIRIIRRSVDARKKPDLFFSYIVDVRVKNQRELYKRCDKKQVTISEEKKYSFPVSGYRGQIRPVIVGMGPAGLFCGYMLAEAGFRPILLERGKPVEERGRDVEDFFTTGRLNPESNVQFGEGGAGTFSDGKLNTLVKDKYGRNKAVLSILVKEGAPSEILYDHKPHIGTDVLSNVIKNMREHILALGGEVHYQTKVTDFEVAEGGIKAVFAGNDRRIPAEYVILAPGHSARDTFQMLYDLGLGMEAKPFAVGFRVEHPQELINLSQYGQKAVEALGSAPYKLTAASGQGRGVYSFCMCPGGYVVNASSEEGRLAVNGMSYSGRDGRNANSAIIISVTPEDYGSCHPLAGIEFQRRLEERAFAAGKGEIPVERYGDFRRAVSKEGAPAGREREEEAGILEDFLPCVKGKWRFADVHEILPHELNQCFVEGMERFGRMIKGFDDRNVLVEGIESRTSSPVRILRDPTLQSGIRGLYPCGEGAGYAGGITSAAMDGIRVAEAVALAVMEKQNPKGEAYGEQMHGKTGYTE